VVDAKVVQAEARLSRSAAVCGGTAHGPPQNTPASNEDPESALDGDAHGALKVIESVLGHTQLCARDRGEHLVGERIRGVPDNVTSVRQGLHQFSDVRTQVGAVVICAAGRIHAGGNKPASGIARSLQVDPVPHLVAVEVPQDVRSFSGRGSDLLHKETIDGCDAASEDSVFRESSGIRVYFLTR
jgi:hypothetical protein